MLMITISIILVFVILYFINNNVNEIRNDVEKMMKNQAEVKLRAEQRGKKYGT